MRRSPLYTLALLLAAGIASAVMLEAAIQPTTQPAPVAEPTQLPNDAYWATVIALHDGDTFKVRVEHGFSVQSKQSLRLFNVYAPELNQKGGPEARDAVAGVIHVGSVVVVRAWEVRGGTQEAEYKQSFGRYIADVWYYDNFGELHSLNDYMRAAIGTPGGTGAK